MGSEPGIATALVPCTCGELVQGILDGEPFLVSCPIDRYSHVRVALGPKPPNGSAPPSGGRGGSQTRPRTVPPTTPSEGNGPANAACPRSREEPAEGTGGLGQPALLGGRVAEGGLGHPPLLAAGGRGFSPLEPRQPQPWRFSSDGPGGDAAPSDCEPLPRIKARQAVEATLAMLGCTGMPFTLEVSCPLPPSKGFGTSTADVVAAIVATMAATGASVDPGQVARLAADVEPSDGTMFPGLALFDHRSARRWEELGPAPPLLVVALDFQGVVDTLEYNARLDLAQLRSMEPDHSRALDLLRRGLREHQPELLGQAATLSAQINQRLLPKPEMEKVIALAGELQALGVCAAHSGTALGVLFGPGETARAHRLLAEAGRRLERLHSGWISRMVDGGARVLESETHHRDTESAEISCRD